MTKEQRMIIAELVAESLNAARALAADGLDAATINGMMRGMFSKAQITALIAEAREQGARKPLPVIA